MNVEVLIDAIVRQTTVLLAQLATSSGARTPLAHTADQVFSDLVRELKAQDMTNAVIADMFGMALRTYHKKVRRLTESATFRGQSLWTAVLTHVLRNGPLLRADLLHRFRNDDETTLRGVLSDMVEGGVLYATGTGDRTVYRALDESELPLAWNSDPEHLAHLVWVAVYRFGPLTVPAIENIVPASKDALSAALDDLVHARRIRQQERDGEPEYSSENCFIPVGSSSGWEGALFDHYQAVVTAICHKLELRSVPGRGAEHAHDTYVGGSTYRFTVWRGHPEYERVCGLLAQLRSEAVQLRQRVEAYNASNDAPSEADYEQFVTYLGQTRLLDDKD